MEIRESVTSAEDPLSMLLAATPELQGIVYMKRTGEVIQTVGEPREQLLKLATFATGLFDLASRLAEGTGCGAMLDQIIRAEQGHVVVRAVDEEHLLFALGRRDAGEGALLSDVEWASSRLKRRSP